MNVKQLKDKQKEKLKNKPEKERALAAARRAMEEMRPLRKTKEPEHITAGKSDEKGRMIVDELTPNDELDFKGNNIEDANDD